MGFGQVGAEQIRNRILLEPIMQSSIEAEQDAEKYIASYGNVYKAQSAAAYLAEDCKTLTVCSGILYSVCSDFACYHNGEYFLRTESFDFGDGGDRI